MRSGAKLHTAEALNRDGSADRLGDAVEILLNGNFAVSDVILLRDANLGAVLRGHTLLDADESLLGRKLTLLLLERVELDFELGVDLGLRNVLGIDVLGSVSGDLEADHVSRIGELGRIGLLASELDENADLAAHMDVAGKNAGTLERVTLAAADLDVLARLGEEHLVIVVESGFDILALERDLSGIVDELDERFGLGDEVGFAVDFGESHRLLVGGFGEGDDALLGLLVDALGGNGETLLTKILDSLFHIAVGGGESFLASAHTGGGRFAEFLDFLNGNSHCEKPFVKIVY